MNTSAKQTVELELAKRFLSTLGIENHVLRPSDRPDVIVQLGTADIGIEVTQFHGDESLTARGSNLRKAEVKFAQQTQGKSYAMWGIPDPVPPLVARINAKISKSSEYDASRLSELWLLISAAIPNIGAIASTYAMSEFVDLAKLNIMVHEQLNASKFSAVYFHILPGTLYRWKRLNKWCVLVKQ